MKENFFIFQLSYNLQGKLLSNLKRSYAIKTQLFPPDLRFSKVDLRKFSREKGKKRRAVFAARH